ncbi:MAG: primosomal protein N' [Bacteroidales bacterium]|nr:primosomal protein N' [Bacteroidales bacterium]
MDPDNRLTLFADVIVPIPVRGTFTYRVPFVMNGEVAVGKRAIVQFGSKKLYACFIYRVHQEIPKNYIPKYIIGVLDEQPIMTNSQFGFWEWMREYYLCHLGEVMQAALPTVFKLNSESKIVLADGFVFDKEQLNENEFLITEALSIQEKLSLTEVSKIVGFLKVMPLIKTMVEKKIIAIEEELNGKYSPKIERFMQLSPRFSEDDEMRKLMDELGKRAFKQLEIVLAFLSHTRIEGNSGEVEVKIILEKSKAALSQLKSLSDKGVFEVYDKVVSRLVTYSSTMDPAQIQFTGFQQIAYSQIKALFEEKNVVLLHGVTSSGKTELYIKLIQEEIEKNRQVLFMLPEIALTTQIINRLRKYFGPKVGVYHSRYNLHERGEIWNKVLSFDESKNNNYQIIIGPRSALFLPYSRLGLIIVDEEHDGSFKQFDPAPRYNARDAAIVLATTFNAKVLLGSATPSYESYYNAQIQKYGLVTMTERYGGIKLPDIQIVNVREETKRKTMQSHFSKALIDAIKIALKEKEQVILFQNRRGFSLRIECDKCNWIPGCKNCDVSLIYHKKQNMLRCHYCGYAISVPAECPDCHSTQIHMHGFGTEKVEEELGIILPEAKIARLDLDTTRSKNAFQQIIEDFENAKTNILVGTQMVTKGLDFEKVRIVGILNADNMLSYPDFRAFENSFQLMSQVSGRAGRKGKQGIVMIQTYQPSHPILHDVVNYRYESLYNRQMEIRKQFKYPPFYRLILLRLKHRDKTLLDHAAYELAEQLKKLFKNDVLGPEYPSVQRIKTLYIKQILLKFDRKYQSSKVKELLGEQIHQFELITRYKSVMIHIDVDPQ